MHIDYVPFFLLNSVHDKIVEADTALMRIDKRTYCILKYSTIVLLWVNYYQAVHMWLL